MASAAYSAGLQDEIHVYKTKKQSTFRGGAKRPLHNELSLLQNELLAPIANRRADCHPNAAYFVPKRSVGQSFGFASELPLGPELALLPLNHREFIAKRVGRKAGGGAEAPAPQG